MPDRPKVLALLPLQHHYARQIAAGLRRHERQRGRWHVRFAPADAETITNLQAGRDANVVGMVVFAASLPLVDATLAAGICAVNVSGRLARCDLPTVITDNHHLGRLAGEHLLDRGLKRFAYVGVKGAWFSRAREDGFRDAISAAGCSLQTFEGNDIPALVKHLRSSDWPIGVMTCHDRLARVLADECLDIGLEIPGDLAIVGADDSEMNTQQGQVLITSVPTEGARVGLRAAGLLEELIDGGPPPDEPVLIQPLRVIERESTNMMATEDPALNAALHLIHLRACDPIDVAQVAREAGIGRRTLEKSMRQHLGRSPHQEIRRVQLQRACELLAETDLTVAQVARQCGFTRPTYFMREFRNRVGQTPSQFRRESRR